MDWETAGHGMRRVEREPSGSASLLQFSHQGTISGDTLQDDG